MSGRLIEDKRHPISLDAKAGQTQAAIFKNMAAAAHMHMDMDQAAEKKLSQVVLPRGQAHFGPIGDDVQRIAKDNGLFAGLTQSASTFTTWRAILKSQSRWSPMLSTCRGERKRQVGPRAKMG